MIRRSDEMVSDIREQMRGGKGSVEIIHIFKQDELKGKARLFAKITLNPDCSIGMHKHENEEEVYYILEGRGLVDDNGSEYTVEAGDAVLTGQGESHSIENIGDQLLEMMAVILLYQ